MKENMLIAFIVAAALLLCATILVTAAIESDNARQCGADYTKTITVDKAEKIPAALSNAIECIKSKGFVLTKLNIRKPIGSGKCVITAGGKDLGNVLEILDD